MRLRIRAAAATAALLGSLGLLAVPAETVGQLRGDFFGMVTNIWGDVMPQRMRDLGANWIRAGCAWADVQPSPNPDSSTWNWDCPDSVMAANAQGFHVVYGLGNAPAWANGGKAQIYPPTSDHLSDWYHYCAELMRRYRGLGVVYEVWNEPNLDVFFMGSFDDYANLIRGASLAARAIDPTARISGPETSDSSTLGRASWYHDAISQLGGMLDIVTTHWYCWSSCGESAAGVAQRLTTFMNARKAELPVGVPLWLTETGLASKDDGLQAAFYDGVLTAYNANFRSARRRWTGWQNVFFYHLLADDDNTIVRLDAARTNRLAFYHYQTSILGDPYAVPRPGAGGIVSR